MKVPGLQVDMPAMHRPLKYVLHVVDCVGRNSPIRNPRLKKEKKERDIIAISRGNCTDQIILIRNREGGKSKARRAEVRVKPHGLSSQGCLSRMTMEDMHMHATSYARCKISF